MAKVRRGMPCGPGAWRCLTRWWCWRGCARSTLRADNMTRADGPGVSFFDLPDYHGPRGYLRALPELKRRTRTAIDACRHEHSAPSRSCEPARLGLSCGRSCRPYAVEVVGDPWDALGPSTWPSPLRPYFRLVGTQTKKRFVPEPLDSLPYPASVAAALSSRAGCLRRCVLRCAAGISVCAAAYFGGASGAHHGPRYRESGRAANPFRVGFIGSSRRCIRGRTYCSAPAKPVCARE